MAIAGFPAWIDGTFGAAVAVAAFTDYRSGKIYNWLTLPLLAFGIATAAVCSAFAASLSGAGVAALVFVPLFALGITGGGDVKLMVALGSVLGVSRFLELAYVALLTTAAGGAVLLVAKGRVKVFFREVFLFFRSLAARGLEVHWPKLSRDVKAPFGVAILVAWVALYVRHRGGA